MCWACGKFGHYPQSPLCKAKKIPTKKKQKFEKEIIKHEEKLNKESMNQINKRIKQLEDLIMSQATLPQTNQNKAH